jgi:beta-1,4-mannosyltransferase
MLAMKFGKDHKIVEYAKWYEQKFGHKAYAHLTVTDKMREELASWGVKYAVLVEYVARNPLTNDTCDDFLHLL